MKSLELTGMVFDRWTVISFSTFDKNKKSQWNCKCECGIEREVSGSNLVKRTSRSCGCLKNEVASRRLFEHGLIKDPLYVLWGNVKTRCYREWCDKYKYYGGRGIRMWDGWKDNPAQFIRDIKILIGERPSILHSLDRADNSGNYTPMNVRWSTSKEQAANRRT